MKGVGVLKIEESESELLCTDSTALGRHRCAVFMQNDIENAQDRDKSRAPVNTVMKFWAP
jgi:hypothetical protein